MDSDNRGAITSACREAAKTFDMETNGSRWKCEVTKVEVTSNGLKKYKFYVHDKKSGYEYEVTANLENNEDAAWNLEKID